MKGRKEQKNVMKLEAKRAENNKATIKKAAKG